MAEVDAGNVFLLAVLLLFPIIKMYSRRKLLSPAAIPLVVVVQFSSTSSA